MSAANARRLKARYYWLLRQILLAEISMFLNDLNDLWPECYISYVRKVKKHFSNNEVTESKWRKSKMSAKIFSLKIELLLQFSRYLSFVLFNWFFMSISKKNVGQIFKFWIFLDFMVILVEKYYQKSVLKNKKNIKKDWDKISKFCSMIF